MLPRGHHRVSILAVVTVSRVAGMRSWIEGAMVMMVATGWHAHGMRHEHREMMVRGETKKCRNWNMDYSRLAGR